MFQITYSQVESAVSFFVFGFLELSILFLGVSYFVEIINALMNPSKVQKILSSSKSGYLIASGLGSITPFCSCSSIPLTLGLIKAKAGFGPIMTFLFTSPLINPIVIIVFIVTFGLKITIMYGIVAIVASLIAGYTLEKLGFEQYIKVNEELAITSSCSVKVNDNKSKITNFSVNKNPKSCCDIKIEDKIEKISFHKKVFNKEILKTTWVQFLTFLPYLAIGIGIGAIVHGFVPDSLLKEYAGSDNILAVPFSAIVGIPLYIRASTMVGLGPELIQSGVSMGSILALTIAGAGASLPEMIMLKKIFKLPIMIAFIFVVFLMAIGCGYIVNLYFI